MTYNVVLLIVSGTQYSESVIHVHISTLSQVIPEYEFPVLYSQSLLVFYCIYSSVYMSIPSPSLSIPLYLLITLFVLYICQLYFCFVDKFICTLLIDPTKK